MIPQRYLPYFAIGLLGVLVVGLVFAGAATSGNSGGFLQPKFVAKLYVRVHRGSWDAWKVEIVKVDYTVEQTMIALDIGNVLSFWTGTYKVCARAYRGTMFSDEDCTEVNLSPGDTKDVALSLNLGDKQVATVKIVVYDEGGEVKDEREVQLT